MITTIEMSFNDRITDWARAEFNQELHTDFQRIRRFTGVWVKEIVDVFLARSDHDLEILCRILPSGVFSEDPKSYERRKSLQPEELNVLLRFRRDYDSKTQSNYASRMSHARKLMSDKISPEVRDRARKGNELLKTVAKSWAWKDERASVGEWGLWHQFENCRVTVGIHLNRSLELSYWVAICDDAYRINRLRDDFLSVLGLATAHFDVTDFETFEKIFLEATEFGKWHTLEYLTLLGRK